MHAATVRQSAEARVTLHVNFSSAAGEFGVGWDAARGAESGAFRHVKSQVPARLARSPDFGWLFDSEAALERWRASGGGGGGGSGGGARL